MLIQFTELVLGCIGAAAGESGTYRLDFAGGVSRQATPEEIHAAALALITQQIKADRDRRKIAGTPVGEHAFHSDPDSRIQQIGLVMMGAALPAGIQWKTIGGAFVEMTPQLAGQIFQATASRDVALFAAAEAHIAAAAASDDPLAYDSTAGWPA